MVENVGELVFVQIFYIVVLILIIMAAHRQNQKGTFYWCIAGLYALVLIWFIYEYFGLGAKPDPGSVFAWVMLLMVIPGILVFIALIVFIIFRIIKRKN